MKRSATDLLEWVERVRRDAADSRHEDRREQLSQYFTPSVVAQLMGTMLAPRKGRVFVLDPGAGVGPLAATAAVRLVSSATPPDELHVVAYELDAELVPQLSEVLHEVRRWCEDQGVPTTVEVREQDFLAAAAEAAPTHPTLGFDASSRIPPPGLFDVAILNPPYAKIGTTSREREQARRLGVETSNIYAAFWAAAISCVRSGGDVVSITPRSFCNGAYFQPFRHWLLERAAVRRVHVFDSRNKAFRDAGVLQENVITHLKVGARQGPVRLTAQEHPLAKIRPRSVPFERVVQPADARRFIHIVPDDDADIAAGRMTAFTHTLDELGLQVSTGRVVDFRARDLLRQQLDSGSVPLVYPTHLRNGRVVWPNPHGRKPNAIARDEAARRGLLVPDGDYTLVKRFTTKEERRRVVAAVCEAGALGHSLLGFENHVNYFHRDGWGIDPEVALGLAIYLNMSIVDDYLRQFSGHTQVNAGDLRSLHYPSLEQLKEVGTLARIEVLASQDATDALACEFFF